MPEQNLQHATAAEALKHARDEIECDLSYIRELADVIGEGGDAGRIEALAESIMLMHDRVAQRIDALVDEANGERNG